MDIKSGYIVLNKVQFWANHGVAPQETCIGNEFYITLRLKLDLKKVSETDNLSETVSYADVYSALKEEMAVPSNLLEHVCGRIVRRLFNEFQMIQEIDIELLKRNPPMGADLESAGVVMHCSR